MVKNKAEKEVKQEVKQEDQIVSDVAEEETKQEDQNVSDVTEEITTKVVEPETRFYLIGNVLIREYIDKNGKAEYGFKEIFDLSSLAVFRYGWNVVSSIKTLEQAKDKVSFKRKK